MPLSITSDNQFSRADARSHTAMIQEAYRPYGTTSVELIKTGAAMSTEAMIRAVVANAPNLTALRQLTVAQQTSNAPVVTTDPVRVAHPINGADGKVYFIPQARLASRSKVTDTPYLFFERRNGEVYLQAWFELVRHSSIRTQSKPLPIDGFKVALVHASNKNNKIDFGRVDELPASEGSDSILSQLLCETKIVDLDQAIDLLQNGTFRVDAKVHYSLKAPDPKPKPKPKRKPQPGRAYTTARPATRVANPGTSIGRRLGSRISGRATAKPAARYSVALPTEVYASTYTAATATAVAKPASTPTKKSKRVSLGAHDGSGVRARFDPKTRKNGPIYAQLESGFGSQPWSEWVESPNGRFIESPVRDRFYVLPDEYRLSLNPMSGMPAMEVLLVPPDQPNDGEPASFSTDYKFRCRFGIVPWLDPARVERLREEIAKHSGIIHPKLMVGGIQGAACELSKTYDSLGSSLVGEADAAIEVDPLGFDLVMDCTSEFYRLLARLLVTDGVTADVKLHLMTDAKDAAPTDTVPVRLRLDRPAGVSLQTELIRPSESAEGEEALTMPALRISNHAVYDATVTRLSATLLVTGDGLQATIGAVQATPSPSGFTIPAATAEGPTTLDVALTPEDSTVPPLYGAADVGFVGLSLAIDPRTMLDRVHDLGASAEIFSTIDIQSYQLANPESLPESHSDLFGIEAEFRRPGADEDDAVTAFLTLAEPEAAVQVAFSVADLLGGATLEQPRFAWRRRNMRGSGTGPWSEWEEIIGRNLYIFPEGL